METRVLKECSVSCVSEVPVERDQSMIGECFSAFGRPDAIRASEPTKRIHSSHVSLSQPTAAT